VFGTNAITVYMLAELLQSTLGSIVVHGHGDGATLQSLIYSTMFHWPQAPGLGSLAYAVTLVAVWFLPVIVLYRQKIFLKV
jgi:predicted acyltransferase